MKHIIKVFVSLLCCSLEFFTSCSESPDKRAAEVAEKALYSLTEASDSIKILQISKPERFYV